MGEYNRRAFLGASLGAFSALQLPKIALAQTCVTSGWPAFTPNRLTVDCASRRNFAVFRKNPTYMGLAGCVSMTFVQGKYGSYTAGNLFLFPWLNEKGRALGAAKDWQTVVPTNATKFLASAPIPNWNLPLDEFFLRYKLVAPIEQFIGFRVDQPFGLNDSRRPWFTNVAKLSDGKPVGIGWNSSNLNGPWFGGSRWIPNTDPCKGNAWRALIIDGLNQASVGVC
ncbi:MAG: hypothetical protein QOF14_1527 [Hyphomicrobiales bacterium]|jgi:hypothetical protein|nr:hypothetical protein [Hyphomicrobiales bacterium]